MIVVDASAVANALTDDGPIGQICRAELARDVHWVAPEHLIDETFSAIRGRYLGGTIGESRCTDALHALGSATIELMHTIVLLPRMWELRANVSGYDAAYVATAETLDCPLVTSDARLARVTGLRCAVRLAIPAG